MTPVEEYIQNQVPSIQPKLELLRQAIREVAPEVEEVIRYNMPTFKLNKRPRLKRQGFYFSHLYFPPLRKLLACYSSRKILTFIPALKRAGFSVFLIKFWFIMQLIKIILASTPLQVQFYISKKN